MEIIAVSKSVRIAPRKIRLIADSIRKQTLEDALVSLPLLNKRGASTLNKTLKSAIANAKNNHNIHKDVLFIKSIEINEAPFYKRFRPSTRGRVHPYKRRGTHIKIVLADNKSEKSNSKPEIKEQIRNPKIEKETK